MKKMNQLKYAAFVFTLLGAAGAAAATINGAGATFPSSVYKEWGKAYEDHAGVVVRYLDTSSGNGISQIEAKAVDFGASDMPLHPEELAKRGLVQFPAVAGGVVLVTNIPGIGDGALKLDGAIVAGIFLGKITKWNHPAIVTLNPGLPLPDATINVVHRAENSGTTFIFTHYLSKVSAEWKSTMGEGTTVPWKVGTPCRSNLVIPVCLYQATNSIGYMDYGYAKQRDMAMVQLRNRAGQFVAPSIAAFQAATGNATWDVASDFHDIPTDAAGEASWPIVGATFIMMHKTQEKPEAGKAVLKFFDWAYSQGDTAKELGYVPLPRQVQDQIRQGWAAKIRDLSGNPI